ncbi:2Fe-2S iron-sulfur cluster-binding protein [Effusibacillus consociatus]|uniref:2Fe-2S iron-sulfur cluster-binding protein n=1 Tax=Effusibacillus consociatus TaxID=1117041 RepID=A0ABV9Q3Q4_9BACL
MQEKVTLTMDGQEVTVSKGTTLLQAAEILGIFTPALCYHEHFEQPAVCRVCVMEIEGARTLVPSCARLAENGMKVFTDSERVRHSRKMVVEMLQSAIDPSQAHSLNEFGELYGTQPERFEGFRKLDYEVKEDNPFFVRDYSKCITCNRCVQACGDQAQFALALTVAGRGFDAMIATGGDSTLFDSTCVFCSNCVHVCPTGALVSRNEYEAREKR